MAYRVMAEEGTHGTVPPSVVTLRCLRLHSHQFQRERRDFRETRKSPLRVAPIVIGTSGALSTAQRTASWPVETRAMDAFFLMSSMINAIGPVSWRTLRSIADLCLHPAGGERRHAYQRVAALASDLEQRHRAPIAGA
jgi:hypothetical protein